MSLRSSTRPRAALRSVTALLALALVATACGGSDDAQPTSSSTTIAQTSSTDTVDSSATTAGSTSSSSTAAPSSSTTEPAGPLSPLNGMPVEDPTLLDRKVIGVKVDNHWRARPQSGIEQADAIIEIVVEAGLTRFIALFHDSDSEWVGPMRSGRPTDGTMLAPLNGALAFSGAQSWVQSRLVNNGVPLIGDLGVPVTRRWSERRAPHNLYGNTVEMRAVAEQRGLDQTPPEPLFTWGPLNAAADAVAEDIFFDWTDSIDITWQWDGTQYLRFVGDDPHSWRSQDGETEEQVAADTLVVLMAERYFACPSGSGSCVPAWDTEGTNRAMVFAGGQYVEGTWARDDLTEWFTLTTDDGTEIVVPPGRMWIMVYPETADITW